MRLSAITLLGAALCFVLSACMTVPNATSGTAGAPIVRGAQPPFLSSEEAKEINPHLYEQSLSFCRIREASRILCRSEAAKTVAETLPRNTWWRAENPFTQPCGRSVATTTTFFTPPNPLASPAMLGPDLAYYSVDLLCDDYATSYETKASPEGTSEFVKIWIDGRERQVLRRNLRYRKMSQVCPRAVTAPSLGCKPHGYRFSQAYIQCHDDITSAQREFERAQSQGTLAQSTAEMARFNASQCAFQFAAIAPFVRQ